MNIWNLKNKKIIIFISFIIATILVSSYFLTQYKIESIKHNTYKNISANTKAQMKIMIDNKKKLTIFIALALAQNRTIIKSLQNNDSSIIDLNYISKEINNNSKYKNLWYQILDTNGNSFYRSWTDKKGDSLLKARPEIQKLLDKPQVISTISTGKFAMTFKSMVPIFNNSNQFIGIFEVISHFNSISKELYETENINSLFVVDKEYKKQITKPFCPLFIDDYYITSLKPNEKIVSLLQENGIEYYLKPSEPYLLNGDGDHIVITYSIPDINGKNMGYSLIFIPLKNINDTKAELFQQYIQTIMIALVLLVVFLGYYLLKREHEKEIVAQYEAHEQDLVKSTKFLTIGHMAAGITHEINTPLTYIKGTVEMSKQDLLDMPDNKYKTRLLEDYETIYDGLNRINIIVESMREMSQTELEIKEKFNIYSTIIIVLRMIYNRSKLIAPIYVNGKQFDFQNTKKEEFEFLSFVHVQRIEQVWTIILNNALDELQKIEHYDDRKIDINIKKSDNKIVVEFIDNAGGVSESILGNLFEPFTSTKASSGLGIGLNVAKKIVEEHNGRINVKNLDFGACFTVELESAT